MDRWKAEMGRGREKRRVEESRSEKRKSQKKEDADARKGRKVAKHCVFPIVAPEGRKVGSLKRRVRSHLARWEMKNCTPLWREANLQVKMYTKHQVWTTFGSWDVGKVHAVVARSTFRSQNVQNTSTPDHFWKLRCRKSTRRCGTKHILKSKCTKHSSSGPLLEVEMSKKCTLLWRDAHFEVKSAKTLTGTEHFWTFRCAFAWQAQGIVHLVKSEQNVRALSHFQKRWQAWGIWRGSSKMHFAWQAQYKRHVHQRC